MKLFLKGISFIFIGIIILMCIAGLVFYLFVHYNNSEKVFKTETLTAKNFGNKSALIVYQPSKMSSFTKDMAYDIGKGLNEKGYEVTICYPGKKLSQDISKYNLIVFGSPIYIGQTSTVLNDYIKSIKSFGSKKVVMFATGAQKDASPFKSMEVAAGNANIIDKVQFIGKASENNEKAYKLGCEIGE